MSTRNLAENLSEYKLSSQEKNLLLSGHTYDAKRLIYFQPSLYNNYKTSQMNPASGSPGTSHRVDVPITEEANYADAMLEFAMTNNDGTLALTVFQPYRMFSEIRVLIGQQELCYFDTQEQIFLAINDYTRGMTNVEFLNWCQTIFPTAHTTPLSGETLAAGATNYWSLPLWPLIQDGLKNVALSDGFKMLTVEYKFVPNYNTAADNGLFVKSSTTSNPWTSSVVAFSDIKLRYLTAKHSDRVLRNVPNPKILLNRYDVKPLVVSWNATTAQQRYQLNTDFTTRNLVSGMYFYFYNSSAVTAYNDADCCLLDSNVDLIGFEVKFRSNTIVKYDAATDKGRKVKYFSDSHFKRFNKNIDPALINLSDNRQRIWNPLVYLDFEQVHCGDDSEQRVFSGLPSSEQIEIILTNNTGSYSTSAKLYAALCFKTECQLNQNGRLSWTKV